MSEELSSLESLVASKGWARLTEIADGQYITRLPQVLGPLPNVLELGVQEFAKGEIQGIKLFTLIPKKRIEDLKVTIIELDKEIENAARSSSRRSDSDGGDSDGSAPNIGTSPGDGT